MTVTQFKQVDSAMPDVPYIICAKTPAMNAVTFEYVTEHGAWPWQFMLEQRPDHYNDLPSCPQWAKTIIDKAKTTLAYRLNLDSLIIPHTQESVFSDEAIQVIKKSCSKWEKKKHNFPLTTSMAKAGWTTWNITTDEITRADALARVSEYKQADQLASYIYKALRYPVHFWVSPCQNHIVWGKLKIDKKFIPPNPFTRPVDYTAEEIVEQVKHIDINLWETNDD